MLCVRRGQRDYGKYQSRVLCDSDPLLHRQVSMRLGVKVRPVVYLGIKY